MHRNGIRVGPGGTVWNRTENQIKEFQLLSTGGARMATSLHISVHHVFSLTSAILFKFETYLCLPGVIIQSRIDVYLEHLAYRHHTIFQNFHNLVCWSTQCKSAVPSREMRPELLYQLV